MTAPIVHVIDDDAAVRDSLAMLLSAEGLQAVTYESAEAFLDVDAPWPGCVLADVQLAGMDGVTLADRLAAQGSPFGVVLMTGRSDARLLARARAAGAVQLLGKPFSSEDLLAALASAFAANR